MKKYNEKRAKNIHNKLSTLIFFFIYFILFSIFKMFHVHVIFKYRIINKKSVDNAICRLFFRFALFFLQNMLITKSTYIQDQIISFTPLHNFKETIVLKIQKEEKFFFFNHANVIISIIIMFE